MELRFKMKLSGKKQNLWVLQRMLWNASPWLWHLLLAQESVKLCPQELCETLHLEGKTHRDYFHPSHWLQPSDGWLTGCQSPHRRPNCSSLGLPLQSSPTLWPGRGESHPAFPLQGLSKLLGPSPSSAEPGHSWLSPVPAHIYSSDAAVGWC